MNTNHQVNNWGKIVAEAWQDEAFKKRLIADPSAVLKEIGINVPAGVQLRVVENTDGLVPFTFPAKPRQGELSNAELAGVAAGGLASGLMEALGIKPQPTNQPKQPEQPFQPQPQPRPR